MAYDNKQLKTFKWLDGIQKDYRFPIMMYSGILYATDSFLIAKVEYPEFFHLSDFYWSEVIRYTDDDGFLSRKPELAEMSRQFKNHRIFDEWFPTEFAPLETRIDPKFMRKALKVFEINRITPNMCVNHDRVELSGHNADVSIRVMFLGVR